jgi:hypothetical protein
LENDKADQESVKSLEKELKKLTEDVNTNKTDRGSVKSLERELKKLTEDVNIKMLIKEQLETKKSSAQKVKDLEQKMNKNSSRSTISLWLAAGALLLALFTSLKAYGGNTSYYPPIKPQPHSEIDTKVGIFYPQKGEFKVNGSVGKGEWEKLEGSDNCTWYDGKIVNFTTTTGEEIKGKKFDYKPQHSRFEHVIGSRTGHFKLMISLQGVCHTPGPLRFEQVATITSENGQFYPLELTFRSYKIEKN